MSARQKKGIVLALLAAALYALSAPFSKLLLSSMPSTFMAGFLYLKAGICMALLSGIRKIRKQPSKELHLTRAQLPYTIAMIVLDIAGRSF